MLDVLTPPTRTALQTTLQQLGNGMQGQGDDLNTFLGGAPSTLNDVKRIAAAAASPQANVAGLLHVLDSLSVRFSGHSAILSELLHQTNTTLDALNVGADGPLKATIADLPSTLQRANVALLALDQPLADTQAAMVDLAPGAASLGQSTPDLRGFLVEAVGPLAKVPGVINQANPGVSALTTTFANAQPLVPRLDEGLAAALFPVQTLSFHRPDIQNFSANFSSVTEAHDSARPWIHYIRAQVPENPGFLGGLSDQPHDNYPPPGFAAVERAK